MNAGGLLGCRVRAATNESEKVGTGKPPRVEAEKEITKKAMTKDRKRDRINQEGRKAQVVPPGSSIPQGGAL